MAADQFVLTKGETNEQKTPATPKPESARDEPGGNDAHQHQRPTQEAKRHSRIHCGLRKRPGRHQRQNKEAGKGAGGGRRDTGNHEREARAGPTAAARHGGHLPH